VQDTHDCSVDIGDAFLAQHVPALLDALGPDGLLVVTYDEGSSDAGCCRLAAGGRVVTVFAGGRARPGTRVDQKLDHYSLLRTVEDLFGLDHLEDAGCTCTPPATALLR
jgi:acid phosphatase